MVDKAKLLERLMATFLDELDEHVHAINEELMALEKDPGNDAGGEHLSRLFRAAHSLKGASRAVDLPGIEQVCHHMEDVFTGIRDDRLQLTPDVCSVLFEVADAIESAGMQLREKSPIDNAALGALLPRLRAVAQHETVPARPEGSERVPLLMPDPTPISPVVASPPDEVRVEENLPIDKVVASEAPAASPEPIVPSPVLRTRMLPTTVRVAEEKLDSLLAQSGELLVARQRVEARPRDLDPLLDLVATWRAEWRNSAGTLRQLAQQEGAHPLMQRSTRLREHIVGVIERNGERLNLLEEQLEKFSRDLTADSRQLKLASTVLQEDVHRIRMLPFAEACAGLERAVHDVCRATGKQVELVIEGGDIEVDRSVLEGLSDPLMHLVRNAVDHGIESLAERLSAHKSLPATVTVKAAIEGAEVAVIVADDGRGLNLEKIRQRVRSRGLPEPTDEAELARCIFLPGFSTAEIVTEVSGRGVGMDVVKSRIESLHGRIDITSQPGFGTRFTLSVPLTLTTVSALFVRVSGQTYAFPTSTVARLVRFDESQLQRQLGEPVLALGAVPIRVVSLADVLELSPEPTSPAQHVAVLTTTGERPMLFVVDEVVAEHEAVVKTLGSRIREVPHVSGAITLRSGALALLLNTARLTRSVNSHRTTTFAPQWDVSSTTTDANPKSSHSTRVLVVDDSMTTRTLLKSILESAGYDVAAAADGQDAWELLQAGDVDVLVSDVDMPRINGFQLTELVRQSPDQGQLPVILVTSRDNAADKARGVEVGADAYLVKSSFDQSNILETIEQFL